MTGTTVVSERPSRARSRNSVPAWRSSRISTTQSAPAAASGIGGERRRADRDGRHLAARDHLDARRRVEADDRAARPVGAEQRQLRLEVLAHVGVVVEVVVGQVRESGDVEHDAVDAATAERLRADLDGDGLDAALAHQGEERVHLVRLGSRQPRHDHLARDVALGRGRQPGR